LQPLIATASSRDSILYQRGLVEPLIDPRWLRTLGMLPGWYLRYFYYPDRILEEDRRLPHTRGVEDKGLEVQLQRMYATAGYGPEAVRIQQERGGAQYYLPAVQSTASIVNDSGDVIIADVRNGGALPDLMPDVCVEVPVRIGRDRAEPVPVGPMPLSVRGLVQAVKTYEELTVEAALSGDEGLALQALVAHPLVGSYPKARAFLDRVLENERPYLAPQFFS
jgi:6-phospho-beta-glucosidase